MRSSPGLVLAVALLAPARAAATSCVQAIQETMELELVHAVADSRLVPAPAGLRTVTELYTRPGVGVGMYFGADASAVEFKRSHGDWRAVPPEIQTYLGAAVRRSLATICGNAARFAPIVPGVYVAADRPRRADGPASLWVTPGRDRVEVKGRFAGAELLAVYAVRCAYFLPGRGAPDCAPGVPSPARRDWDAPPVAARCAVDAPGAGVWLLLALSVRRRARRRACARS